MGAPKRPPSPQMLGSVVRLRLLPLVAIAFAGASALLMVIGGTQQPCLLIAQTMATRRRRCSASSSGAGDVRAARPDRRARVRPAGAAVNLTVNGTTLYAETLGDGTPCLCLHGGPGTDSSGLSRSLAPVGEALGLRLAL